MVKRVSNFFLVRERGSGTGADRRKEGIKGFEFFGPFFFVFLGKEGIACNSSLHGKGAAQ